MCCHACDEGSISEDDLSLVVITLKELYCMCCHACDEGSIGEDDLSLCQGARGHNVSTHIRRFSNPVKKIFLNGN